MRWWFWLFVVAILALQVAFVPALKPLGVVPNLALVLVVLVGLAGTASQALTVALVSGLLLDMTSGVDFGLRMGLLVLVALVTGYVHRMGLQTRGLVVAVILVMAATVVADLAVIAGLVRAYTGPWPVGSLVGMMVLEMLLNVLITLALQPLVRILTSGGSELLGVE